MTVLEVPCERKPYKIMDRSREIKKGVMAETLVELIERGESFLSYSKYRARKNGLQNVISTTQAGPGRLV